VSEQHEEEILRRWAREQAEIERQTDALVLKALTAMVTAAEDLKSKLRRDVEGILEEYRRTKRSLENEVSLATAERQRFRREVEQERDTIIGEAETRARTIVQGAERERDTLLSEARTKEDRLRTLEEQIRSVFGIEVAAEPITSAPTEIEPEIEPEDADVEPAPYEPVAAAAPAPAFAEPSPAESGFVAASPTVLTARGAAPAPEIEDDEVAETATLPTPAPSRPALARPAAPPPSAPAPQPAGPHPVELVFDGVPGYQQASALEMAVGDLLPDGEVDIVEFEHGQLVLSAQAADLEGLAQELVSSMPASLQLTAVDGDRATFHCV
jgi:hypothetical protein